MHRRRVAVLLLTGLLLTTGCAGKAPVPEETTIEAKKNGTIVHTIVEDFSEEYYRLEALQNMMQESSEQYNASAGKGSVAIEDVALEEGLLTVIMRYKSAGAYAGFNKQAMFVGTVKEAYQAGYDLDIRLQPTDDAQAEIGRNELLEMGGKHLMILREPVDVAVKVWGKVLYHTDNVTGTQEAGVVDVVKQSGLTYILFQ